MAQYSKQYLLLSRSSSAVTSRVVLVADAAEMSLSLVSVGASSVTIQGSNAQGITSAIPENSWSAITLLTTNGIFAVQPGMRWLRAIQAASSSSNTLEFSMTVR